MFLAGHVTAEERTEYFCRETEAPWGGGGSGRTFSFIYIRHIWIVLHIKEIRKSGTQTYKRKYMEQES
jgi:hypothetical protein